MKAQAPSTTSAHSGHPAIAAAGSCAAVCTVALSTPPVSPYKVPAARPHANPATRPERARAAITEHRPARVAAATIAVAEPRPSGAGWPALGRVSKVG